MEINIPMKTKLPMKLDGVVSEVSRERGRPALALGNIRQGSNLHSSGRSGTQAGSNGQGVSSSGMARPSGAAPGRNSVPGAVQVPGQGSVSGTVQAPGRSSVSGAFQAPGQSSVPGAVRTPVQSSPARPHGSGQNSPSAPHHSQPIQHYDIQPQGGKVLNKGGKVSLSPMLSGRGNSLVVCMGWDVDVRLGYDLDASCFMLGENGKVIGDDWFVFYNQPVSPDGAIRHGGEGATGKQEKMLVDLGRLSPRVKRLAFVLTINEAKESRKSFSQVANAHVRILDSSGKKELALFNLNDYEPGITAATVCEIYRYNGEWKINPMGNGLKDTGLLELCHFYGVSVEE